MLRGDPNTELARDVEIMMGRTKRIYILIIKVNKFFIFKNIFSVFLSSFSV